jgi:hypothetical protein
MQLHVSFCGLLIDVHRWLAHGSDAQGAQDNVLDSADQRQRGFRTQHVLTLLAQLVLSAAVVGFALPAQAIPVPVGDPQVYAIVQFYAASGTALYITPNPVAARGDLGLVEAQNAGGTTVGTALTSGFGLYGATARWPGNGRHENGTQIDGATASLLYDQRYRGVGDFISDLHMSLFGMALEVVDPDRRNRNYYAAFQLMVSLLPVHPPAPGFADVANFDFNPPASEYTLRMFARVSGHDGNFDYVVDCTGCFDADPVPTIQRGSLGLRLDIADMSFDLGAVIPRDNEFTVRTYLRVEAFGPRGEGFASAQFYDPIRGFGGKLEPSVNTGPSTPVPEPATLWLIALGLVTMGVMRRHWRSDFTVWRNIR